MTRVVVTGFGADGTSTVVRDEQLQPRPGSNLFEVWGYDDGEVSSCLGATQAVEELIMERHLHSEQIWPHFVFRARQDNYAG